MSTTISQESTSPSPAIAADDYNQHVALFLASQSIENPFTVTDTDNSVLSFLCKHQETNGGRECAHKMMFSLDKCRTCRDRFAQLSTISDANGPVLRCFKKIDSKYVHHAEYLKMAEFAESATKTPITGVVFLDKKETLFGHKMLVGTFNHIVCPVRAEHRSTISTERMQLIQDAILRYVISGLFDRFLTRLIVQGKVSLELMKTCLDKAVYGHRLIPAVDWCVNILNELETRSKQWQYFTPKKKIVFAVHHIIRAGLSEDSNGTVALLFETANNNIIELLEKAKSETTMTAMCEDRLNPEKYQRPTVDASEQQIKNASNLLGYFTNQLLTKDRAEELIPEIVHHGQSRTQANPASSMAGFSALLAKAQAAKAKAPSGFASRCGKSSSDVNIEKINSVRKFVEFTRGRPESKVEVAVDYGGFAYAAETTLSKDKIGHRNLWAFNSGWNKSTFGLTGSWAPVAITIPMYEYIVGYKTCLFVIEGIKPRTSLGNCCFPELLTSQYQRVCRTAFEGLNTTTQIEVPDGQLMIGIGSSVSDAYGNLTHPINLRVDGIPVTLLTL